MKNYIIGISFAIVLAIFIILYITSKERYSGTLQNWNYTSLKDEPVDVRAKCIMKCGKNFKND